MTNFGLTYPRDVMMIIARNLGLVPRARVRHTTHKEDYDEGIGDVIELGGRCFGVRERKQNQLSEYNDLTLRWPGEYKGIKSGERGPSFYIVVQPETWLWGSMPDRPQWRPCSWVLIDIDASRRRGVFETWDSDHRNRVLDPFVGFDLKRLTILASWFVLAEHGPKFSDIMELGPCLYPFVGAVHDEVAVARAALYDRSGFVRSSPVFKEAIQTRPPDSLFSPDRPGRVQLRLLMPAVGFRVHSTDG